MYELRTYRHWVKGKDLVSFNVAVKETDLYIRASENLKSKALRLVNKYRRALERYIERYPSFLTSLEPLIVGDDAPQIVKFMAESARKAVIRRGDVIYVPRTFSNLLFGNSGIITVVISLTSVLLAYIAATK